MIPKYHEKSQEVEVHSGVHAECKPEHIAELEEGWECTCTECQCESVVRIQAQYAYDEDGDHKVIIRADGAFLTFKPDVARALASALCFAANDADQLNKDFPKD